MCFISPTQPHTGGETRRHFPVQFSLLNVICYCLLFNLCITIYRMYNVAELILWLESWFLEVFALRDFFFFFSAGFNVNFWIFIYIMQKHYNWVVWMHAAVPTLGPAGTNSFLEPPQLLLLLAELAEWAFGCIQFFCFLPYLQGG